VTAPVRSLPAYILRALDRVELSRRTYQATAAMEALRVIRSGRNAEINLPPGTGKTLISQIVGCIWLSEHQAGGDKVLCVVPSSVLRAQHHNYCDWWAGESKLCKPLEVSPEWKASTNVYHQVSARKTDFWFSLPEIFCNTVDSVQIPEDALDRVALVILDEYDAFSIGILTARGQRLRFTKDYARLLEILRRRERRYLLMSATPARHQNVES